MKLRVKECEHILAQIMTIYILLIVFQKTPCKCNANSLL
jgi:hypothetical protein